MNMKYSKINRKTFIKLTAVAGIVAVILSILSTSCSKSTFERATNTRLAMGTTVTIIFLYEPDVEHEKIMDDTFNEIRRLSSIMNHYDEKSEISRLNRERSLENVDLVLLGAMTEIFCQLYQSIGK